MLLRQADKKSSSGSIISFLIFLFLQAFGDLYEGLDVQYNVSFYPDLPVTLNVSSVMLSPKTYCNPNNFLFRENNSDITLEAHRFLNGKGDNIGCPQGRFRASVR